MLDPGVLVPAPEEIGLRALSRLVREVAMAPFPPRLDRLEKVYRAIVDDPGQALRRTRRHRRSREKERLPRLPRGRPSRFSGNNRLEPGENLIWDGRFRVSGARHVRCRRRPALAGWRRMPAGPAENPAAPRRHDDPSPRRSGELIAVPASWPAAAAKTGPTPRTLTAFCFDNLKERDAIRPIGRWFIGRTSSAIAALLGLASPVRSYVSDVDAWIA
ncbi:MAG: hypothetical protein R3D02_16325 [Hyphomicrobiales bacterium]